MQILNGKAPAMPQPTPGQSPTPAPRRQRIVVGALAPAVLILGGPTVIAAEDPGPERAAGEPFTGQHSAVQEDEVRRTTWEALRELVDRTEPNQGPAMDSGDADHEHQDDQEPHGDREDSGVRRNGLERESSAERSAAAGDRSRVEELDQRPPGQDRTRDQEAGDGHDLQDRWGRDAQQRPDGKEQPVSLLPRPVQPEGEQASVWKALLELVELTDPTEDQTEHRAPAAGDRADAGDQLIDQDQDRQDEAEQRPTADRSPAADEGTRDQEDTHQDGEADRSQGELEERQDPPQWVSPSPTAGADRTGAADQHDAGQDRQDVEEQRPAPDRDRAQEQPTGDRSSTAQDPGAVEQPPPAPGREAAQQRPENQDRTPGAQEQIRQDEGRQDESDVAAEQRPQREVVGRDQQLNTDPTPEHNQTPTQTSLPANDAVAPIRLPGGQPVPGAAGDLSALPDGQGLQQPQGPGPLPDAGSSDPIPAPVLDATAEPLVAAREDRGRRDADEQQRREPSQKPTPSTRASADRSTAPSKNDDADGDGGRFGGSAPSVDASPQAPQDLADPLPSNRDEPTAEDPNVVGESRTTGNAAATAADFAPWLLLPGVVLLAIAAYFIISHRRRS